MNYKKIEEKSKSIIIRGIRDFDAKQVMECGQAFRWIKEEDGSYTHVARGKVVNLLKEEDDLILRNTNLQELENVWMDHFDLNRDYSSIKAKLKKDKIIKEAVEFGEGIRIINQEPFETLVSFIISANNQIPRIKKSIDLISREYGKRIEIKSDFPGAEKEYYSFPNPKDLAKASSDDMREICRVGFRDVRVVDAALAVSEGNLKLEELRDMKREEAEKILCELNGVGPKVANCVLLFAYKKVDAFPVDVWVKRVMENLYLKKETSPQKISEYGYNKFGELSGFAQQYLFYYAREKGIGK